MSAKCINNLLIAGLIPLILGLMSGSIAYAEVTTDDEIAYLKLMYRHGYYKQRNLVTNFPDKYKTNRGWKRATQEDSHMLNAWGLALRPAGAGGHWWIANTDSGSVSLYVGDTIKTPLFQDDTRLIAVEPAPATPGDPATPTGQVFNGSGEFQCTGESFSGDMITAPGKFMVATEDGNIQCWGEAGSTLSERMKSFQIAASGESGSIYKGLAVSRFDHHNLLYAANFSLERIDIFDGGFNPVAHNGFHLPHDIPEFYAPFNIQYFEYRLDGHIRKSLFVAYALTSDVPGEEVAGPGLGYVAEFDLEGNHIRTFEHSARLNAPWGMAIAPYGQRNFGPMARKFLLGNFGDGTIVGFDLDDGRQIDYLRGRNGEAVQIDGLWGLAFGNGESLGRSNYLYFTAGPNDENDGVFGRLKWQR